MDKTDCQHSQVSKQRIWGASLLFLWCFSFLHILALPIVISTDGRNYIHLSHLFFEDNFFEKWNYFRTPLYPLFLRLSFALLGEHSESLELVNVLMLASGITLLGLVVKKHFGELLAASCVVLLGLYPGMVGFSHVALTEVGSFFFLSLVLYVTLRGSKSEWGYSRQMLHAVGIGLAIALGYYFRQTVLYTAVPIIAIFALYGFSSVQAAPSLLKRGLLIVLIALSAYVPTLAWKYFGGDQSFAKVILTYGFVKQQVIPPEDPILGGAKETYVQAIQEHEELGSLGLSGLKAAPVKVVFKALKKRNAIPGIYQNLYKYPVRYMKAFGTSLLFFSGLPAFESQILWWSNMAFTKDGGVVTGNHPRLRKRFGSQTGRSRIATLMVRLYPIYKYAVILGTVFCLLYFFVSLFHGHILGLYLCGVPLFFIALHSATCLTIDRYVLPIQPFLLATLVLFPAYLYRRYLSSEAKSTESS